MMVKATVDRIEGDWIIIVPENGPVFQVPVLLFPGLDSGEKIVIAIERDDAGQADTQERINEIRKGLNRVLL